MAVKFNDDAMKELERRMKENLERAAIYLKTQIKENLNTTGEPYLASQGEAGRHYRNENPSEPGEYPHKMKGELQRSIAHEMDSDGKTAYVGSPLPYALYLEVGTSKMAARPFFRATLTEEAETIKKIIATGSK